MSQSPAHCGTMEFFDENAPVDDFPFYQVTANGLQRSATTTWSVNTGYGTDSNGIGCGISDCSITLANGRLPQTQACDGDPCGDGTGAYLIPVRITIFQDDDGSNQAADIVHVRNYLDIMNAFHCCQGIPIQFYEISGSPIYIQHTGRNTGGITLVSESYDESEYFNILVVNNLPLAFKAYAYFPTSASSPGFTVLKGACFNGSVVSNPCASTNGINTVLMHETGHALGLYHTHSLSEYPDGTNCCTAGDYICDTDADPGLSQSCASGAGCDKDPSACPAPNGGANGTYPTDINAEDNIMSYNIPLGGCRMNYTDCQKAKMVDVLICMRPFCDPDLSRYFSNVSDANIEICIGDPIPSFSADVRTCIQWYDAALGGNNIGSGASPNTAALSAIVNTSVSGEYKVYFEDNNNYNNCRKAVTITVRSDPSDGISTNMQCVSEVDMINLLTVNPQIIGMDEIVAWWITANAPISSSITSQASLNTAVSGANINPANDGTTITGNPSVLFNSSAITEGLITDCSQMDAGTTYYATPVLAQERVAQAATMCTVSVPVTPGVYSKFARLDPGLVPCFPTPYTSSPTFTITVTIAGFTSADLRLQIRRASCPTPNLAAISGVVDGTYIFTENDFPPGFDPHIDGFCLQAYEPGVYNMSLDITMTVTIDLNYPAIPAIPFPSIAYNMGCTFGDAIPFTCSDFEVTAVPADCADMTAPYDIEFDFLDPTPSPNFTVSGLVTGTLSGDGVLSGAAGNGVVSIADAAGCETTIPVNFPNVNFAGDGSTIATNLVGVNTINTTLTNSTSLDADETVAWWITKTNSIANTVTNQTLLDAQTPNILNADDGTSNMDNVIISDAVVGSDGLNIDCANLMTGATYYATPFVSLVAGIVPDFSASLVGQANISPTVNNMEVPVCQLPPTATIEKVCVQLDYNTCENYATFSDLNMQLAYNGVTIVLAPSFTGILTTPQTFDICFVDDGTGYTGAGSACNAACFVGDFESNQSFSSFDGIDPNGTWTVIINDDSSLNFYPCEINVSLEFDMPALPIVFPTAYYSDCLFGDPIAFSCMDGAELSPKVFLQGPLSGTTMNTDITAMIPTTSPYADGKILSGSAPTNAVDWVWVEIRSDNTATPAMVYAQSGILLDDGTVTERDGLSPLTFPTAPGQSWYVAIKHRNHLGVMTNLPVVIN